MLAETDLRPIWLHRREHLVIVIVRSESEEKAEVET